MSQIPEIQGHIAYIHAATSDVAQDFEQKASAARCLNRRVAVELTPEDAKNLAKTLRRMMEVHLVLLELVKAANQRGRVYQAELPQLMQRAAVAEKCKDEAVALVETIRDMPLLELLRFRRELRRGSKS